MVRIWKTPLRLMFLFMGVLLFVLFGCSVKTNDGDSGALSGKVVGLVLDAFSGEPVEGANIKAMASAHEWKTAVSDDAGRFTLAGIPAASKVYVETSADGYCPMIFWVDTFAASHQGQTTGVVLEIIRADAKLTVVLTGQGEFLSAPVSVRPISYDYHSVSKTTDKIGEAHFDVGLYQSYQVTVAAVDADQDGVTDFSPATAEVLIDAAEKVLALNLAPISKGDMTLLSETVDETNLVLLFSDSIKRYEVLDGHSHGATLNDPPATVFTASNRAVVMPNVSEGTIDPGDTFLFDLAFLGTKTHDWWFGSVEYEAYGDVLDDDSADDDDGKHPPILSDGYWHPNPAEYVSGILFSEFFWSVCDLGDDLSGGQIFAYQEGSIYQPDIYWDDFGDVSGADNCDYPLDVCIGTNFTGAPAGDYCMDLEATDAAGSLSNMLTDMCVTVE